MVRVKKPLCRLKNEDFPVPAPARRRETNPVRKGVVYRPATARFLRPMGGFAEPVP
jgi:hypothetical protein